MTMERGQSGLRRMGDHDLAARLAGIQQEFARRHPGMNDFSLKGRLPQIAGGEFRLDPSLEKQGRIEYITQGGIEKHDLLAAVSQIPAKSEANARFMVESDEFTTLPESQPYGLFIAPAKALVPHPKGSYPTT